METIPFMLHDVAGTAAALLLFPLVLVVPGYVLGWLTDLFSFRRRRPITQVLWGLALSVAVFPALTYLLARLGSFVPVWVVYGLTWLATPVLIVRQAARGGSWRAAWGGLVRSRPARVVLALVVVWILLAAASLVDYQVGQRLYFSVVANDYTKHVAVTDAVSRTGIPPVNPSYYPGHPVELFYYYFWFMICSLVDMIGGAAVGPRVAVIGGTIWCGLAFLAVVALYLRFFSSGKPTRLGARVAAAAGLIWVSGLDVFPVALESVNQVLTQRGIFYPCVEWWNEPVNGWIDAVLWVPQHVAALLAGMTGLLLFRAALEASRRRERVAAVVLSGLCWTSTVGLSIWVALVFGGFLLLWMGLCLVKRRLGEVGVLLWIGLVTLVTVAPYGADLVRASQLSVMPVAFTVRSFDPVELILLRLGVTHPAVVWGIDLLMLPVNYGVELGFAALAGLVYWQRRSKAGRPLDWAEQAGVALAITSLLVSTFLRSSIKTNDLGWRGLYPAQFVLLLWSSDVAVTLFRRGRAGERAGGPGLGRRVRAAMAVLLVVGVATTLYDLVVLRAYPVWVDEGIAPAYTFLGVDDRVGEHTYASRWAYEVLRDRLPGEEIVQHNPSAWIDPPNGLYGERQIAAADYVYGTLFGIPDEAFFPTRDAIAAAFAYASRPAEVEAICERYGLAALLVRDTDPVWANEAGWVWEWEPLFENAVVRVVGCGEGTGD